jgi:hypothetical protein
MVYIYLPAESANSVSNGFEGDVPQGSRFIDQVSTVSFDLDV